MGIALAHRRRSPLAAGAAPRPARAAEIADVNVNTVRAVYQRLEHEGLIASRQGTGTFVTATPRPPSAVGAIAASAAREALETGVDAREVAAALYVAGEAPASADAATERRRVLRAEIGTLERALGEMESEHPISHADGGTLSYGPTILGTEELEAVRAELLRRLAGVQTVIDAVLAECEPAATRAPAADPGAKPAARSRRGPTRAAPAT